MCSSAGTQTRRRFERVCKGAMRLPMIVAFVLIVPGSSGPPIFENSRSNWARISPGSNTEWLSTEKR